MKYRRLLTIEEKRTLDDERRAKRLKYFERLLWVMAWIGFVALTIKFKLMKGH